MLIKDKEVKMNATLKIQYVFRKSYLHKVSERNKLAIMKQEQVLEKSRGHSKAIISRYLAKFLQRRNNLRERDTATVKITTFLREVVDYRRVYNLLKKFCLLVTFIVFQLLLWLVCLRKRLHEAKLYQLCFLFLPLYHLRQVKHSKAILFQSIFRSFLSRQRVEKLIQLRVDTETKRYSEENSFVLSEISVFKPSMRNKIYFRREWRELMYKDFVKKHHKGGCIVSSEVSSVHTLGFRVKLKYFLSPWWKYKWRCKQLKHQLIEEDRILRYKYRKVHGFDKWVQNYRM